MQNCKENLPVKPCPVCHKGYQMKLHQILGRIVYELNPFHKSKAQQAKELGGVDAVDGHIKHIQQRQR